MKFGGEIVCPQHRKKRAYPATKACPDTAHEGLITLVLSDKQCLLISKNAAFLLLDVATHGDDKEVELQPF